MEPRKRALLWATLIAAVLGFAAGWLTHEWTNPSPEARARDALERAQERVRQLTH